MENRSIDRHFCVTVYIYEKTENAFLMINHKKLKKWLPPGGHVDNNELPDEAAIRECKEETGVDVILMGDVENFEGALVRPLGMQLNVIEENKHEHIDIIYLAREKSKKQTLVLNHHEAHELQWIPTERIISEEFNTFMSTKYWCRTIARNFGN